MSQFLAQAARAPDLVRRFDGAPLDVLKLLAALSMLADHLNSVVLGSTLPLLWRFGRISFPLFCFAMACNLLRGAETSGYARRLLLLGVVTQPIFAMAFAGSQGNILLTLGIGAVLAAALRRQPARAQHLVLGLAAGAVLLPMLRANTGVEFGLAGLLLPAVLLLLLDRRWRHVGWLLLLLFGLNLTAGRPSGEAWWLGPSRDAAIVVLGGAAAVLFAVLFRARPRFLPRYALHLFYPGHLLALIGLRALL